jgi:hypothetical protein
MYLAISSTLFSHHFKKQESTDNINNYFDNWNLFDNNHQTKKIFVCFDYCFFLSFLNNFPGFDFVSKKKKSFLKISIFGYF